MADLRLAGAVLPLALAGLVACIELVALVQRRRRARRLLVSALVDPSPLERRAALRVLVNGGGVRRFVDVLTERARNEEDPTVRDELARALIARGFEGSGTDDLSALRLWAFEHEIRKALGGRGAPGAGASETEGNPGR